MSVAVPSLTAVSANRAISAREALGRTIEWSNSLAKALTSIASRMTLTPCCVNMQQGDPNGNHRGLWLGRLSTGSDATSPTGAVLQRQPVMTCGAGM